MEQFDEKTCQQLGHYVYMLVDPDTGMPFYVGKGVNNRVYQHVDNVRQGKGKSEPKNEEISRILNGNKEVIHYIIRHGLDNDTALIVETSIIDFYNKFSQTKLTNIVSGQDTEHGLMSDAEIKGKYSAGMIPRLPEGFVVININKLFHRGMTWREIYNATKDKWPIRKDKVEGGSIEDGIIRDGKLQFVLSEYRGLIVEVFKVDYWVKYDNEDYNPGSKKRDSGKKRTRYGFVGEVADDSIRDLYLGKRIPIEAKTFPILYSETINAELDRMNRA